MSQVQLVQRSDEVEVAMRPTAPPSKGAKAAARYRCLIVSDSQTWAEMFGRAAASQGWEPIVCCDIEDAARAAVCEQYQLAVVDVNAENSETPNDFRRLAEKIAFVRNPLVMICGGKENAAEEILARKIGAWMYLPGVDDASDVAMLCGESKNIIEKLHPPSIANKNGKPKSQQADQNSPR